MTTHPHDMNPTPATPWSSDAEKGLLSCFLQNPAELLDDAVQTLPADLFHHPAHRLLYDVLLEFRREGRPIDLVTLSNYLIDKALMDRVGGPATLSDLLSFIPTPAHYDYYKGIARDKHLLRRLQHVCQEGLSLIASHDPHAPVADALNEVEQAVIRVREENSATHAGRPWTQLLHDALDRYEEALRHPGRLPGFSTGYPLLDQRTGGFRGGHVWALGGGTSDGKSAFAQNLIVHLCRQRLPVCLYSLEMTAEENTDRLSAIHTGIPHEAFARGQWPAQARTTYTAALKQMREWPLHVRDVSGIRLSALRADMRLQTRQHGIKVFFMDYLQLVNTDQRGHTREREVAEISAAMKTDAKLLGVTVVNLSQLNERGELRESRAIGQDADIVLALKVPEVEDETQREAAERQRILEFQKVRGGQRGKWCAYDFDGSTFRFTERPGEGN